MICPSPQLFDTYKNPKVCAKVSKNHRNYPQYIHLSDP